MNTPQGWNIENGKLAREFTFANFLKAVEFINKVAPIAEAMDHHPDLLLHSYKKVKVTLITHSERKITALDHQLAERLNTLTQN